MDLRLRASPRHGGEGVCILILVIRSAAGASHRGRRHSSYSGGIRTSAPIIVILFYMHYSRKTEKSQKRVYNIIV